MKAGFPPQTSLCKDRDNNLNGNDQLKMKRWKQYYETLNIKDNVEIREELIHLSSMETKK
jgi:hypothetical protein